MTATAFEYRALDARGTARRGVLRAESQAEAFRQLASAGLTPVRLRAEHSGARRRRRVRARDVAHFTYQLGVLSAARIPFSEAIRTIAQQEAPGRFREAVEAVAVRIEAGDRIADALAQHKDVFGDVYIQTIRAAEHTGNLVKVLEYLSEILERELEMRQQIRSALTYPLCVVGVLVMAVVFLVGFVVPRFASIFASRGVDLPPLTQALVALGDSMQQGWYLYLGAVVGAFLTLRRVLRLETGRLVIERAMHRVPFVREILTGVAVARFARVFGLGISSGIGLLDALDMAGRASGRAMLLADARRLMEQVRAGGRLGEVLASCTYLPTFARRMITAGEDSAELPRMCGVVGRHYERETSVLTKNLCTVLEPVLIVTVAAVVLVIALAIFLPMWDMAKLVG